MVDKSSRDAEHPSARIPSFKVSNPVDASVSAVHSPHVVANMSDSRLAENGLRRFRRRTPLDPTTSSENDDERFASRNILQRGKETPGQRPASPSRLSPPLSPRRLSQLQPKAIKRFSLQPVAPPTVPHGIRTPSVVLQGRDGTSRHPSSLNSRNVGKPSPGWLADPPTAQPRVRGDVIDPSLQGAVGSPLSLSSSSTKRKKHTDTYNFHPRPSTPDHASPGASDATFSSTVGGDCENTVTGAAHSPSGQKAGTDQETERCAVLPKLMETAVLDDADLPIRSGSRIRRHRPHGPASLATSHHSSSSSGNTLREAFLAKGLPTELWTPLSSDDSDEQEFEIPEIVISPALLTSLDSLSPGLQQSASTHGTSVLSTSSSVLSPMEPSSDFVRLSRALHERQEADALWRKRFNENLTILMLQLRRTCEGVKGPCSTARIEAEVASALILMSDTFLPPSDPNAFHLRWASPSLSRKALFYEEDDSSALVHERDWVQRLYEEELQAAMNLVVSHIIRALTSAALPLALPERLAYLCLRIAISLSQESTPVQNQVAQRRMIPVRPTAVPVTEQSRSWKAEGEVRPSTPVFCRRTSSVEYGHPPGVIPRSVPQSQQGPVSNVATRSGDTFTLSDKTPPGTMGDIFLRTLRRKLDSILAFGESTKDGSGRLAVPPMPRNTMRWKAYLGSSRQIREERLKEKTTNLRMSVSLNDLTRQQRERAVEGDLRHAFTSAYVVRFVGELYCSGIIEISVVEQWLFRLLFDTAYPGTPSLWELECGCVLLISILPRLREYQHQSDMPNQEPANQYAALGTGKFDGRPISMQRSFSVPCPQSKPKETADQLGPCDAIAEGPEGETDGDDSWSTIEMLDDDMSTCDDQSNSTGPPSRAMSKGHWLLTKPSLVRKNALNAFRDSMGANTWERNDSVQEVGVSSPKNITAAKLLRVSLARLRELQQQPEIHSESKMWIQEVCTLSEREGFRWRGEDQGRGQPQPSSKYRLSVEAKQQQALSQDRREAALARKISLETKRGKAKKRQRKMSAKRPAYKTHRGSPSHGVLS
ncbi:unnamed protein product [Parajaminaea phylloscopi]